MAKLIVVSHVTRNTPKQNAANLVRYMGTREGAEHVPVMEKPGPVTVRQQRLIKDLLKAEPDAKNYSEYRAYENDPTKKKATEFIDAFLERNADRAGEIDKLVKYMAERPGVEKLGSHGLFSQTDEPIDLDAVAEEVGALTGPIWTHIVSLHREDAERLGYHNAQAWRDLVRRNVMELAKAQKIEPENLQWYAAFHDTGDHPHMHLLVYSKDPRQGWLTKQGIAQIKSTFGSDIFRLEQQKLFRMETELRDRLTEDFRYDLMAMERETATYYEPTAEPALLMQQLARQLREVKGKKVYSYLPKDVKKTVDLIVAQLAKDEGIAELYREWNEVNRMKLSLYREKKEPDLPLEDNKEFRKLKNMIIRAAEKIPVPEPPVREQREPSSERDGQEPQYIPEQKAEQETAAEPVEEPDAEPKEEPEPVSQPVQEIPMTYVFNEDQTAAARVPAVIPVVLTELVFALAAMLAEDQQKKLDGMSGKADRKLLARIDAKKRALGRKPDHSAQSYPEGQRSQTKL